MGRLDRLAKLGSLTTKVTGSYIGNKLREAFVPEELRAKAREKLHVDNAKEFVESVGRMKGAAMKLGQQLALLSSSLDLPDEVTSTLGKLNAEGEPVPFDVIREDVERALEAPLPRNFSEFDPKPVGTASLGQAHRARLKDGTEVVVKILHRGVEHSVDTDLLALRAMLVSGRALRRSKEELDEAFDEIRERLKEELDYLQEAANIQAFQEALGADPRVRIPRLHHALCTERILTMDRIPGRHLERWLEGGASPEARQRAGLTLADLYYQQIFRLRMLHADPHPGNYLFDDDGRVGLVDFGCVKRFDPYFMASYATAAIATHDGDRVRCLAACAAMGAWDGVHAEDGELVWQFCRAIGHGFRLGVITLGQDHEQYMDEVMPVIKQLIANPRVRLPRDVIYTHRSLGGLYSIARRLGTRADFGKIMLTHAPFAVAEGTAV
jgi:predicted unusual protein kinase regulating ubiquinone biosynthesis (AarF/ABC1/UbiB family)